MFVAVQCYMGDSNEYKFYKPGASELAQAALRPGLFNQELRDELYCQLCKQVTGNPKRENADRGWELLHLLCGVFPPSETLVKYIGSFLIQQSQVLRKDPNDKEKKYVSYLNCMLLFWNSFTNE